MKVGGAAGFSQFRVLGIDPGTRICGYGLIDVAKGKRLVPVACGAWKLGSDLPLFERMGRLARELERVIRTYTPTHVCLEDAFVSKNIRSALLLGHARGVVMGQASEHGLLLREMTATAAKKAVTGQGRADKALVATTLFALLRIPGNQAMPTDATDALGLAYALAAELRLAVAGTAEARP